MGVEQPACLVALAAVAVPLLLHLRSRRAVRSVPFPNVELLRRVARDVRRERVLAGAWLLAARASVVALAALALARPYVGARPPGTGAPAEGDVVILLDRSSAWADPRAFEEARAAAGEIIDLVKPPGRALLVPFDDLPGPAVDERSARAALEAIRPTGRAHRVGPALAAAASFPSSGDTGGVEGPRGARRPKTVVLITTPDGAAEALAMKRRDGERLEKEHLIVYAPDVTPPERENLAVVAASLEDAAVGVGGKVRVRVRIARTAGAQLHKGGRELRLFFDEDARPAAAMEVPGFVRGFVRGSAGESGAGELDLIIEAPRRRPGASLLRVELHPADARAADDRRFLVLPASERIRVATLASAARGSEVDIRALGRAVEALAKAGRSSAAVLPIESRALPASGLTPEALEPFDVLVVGDVEAVPSGAWPGLTAFVREGGALLALAPGRVPIEARDLFGLDRTEGEARSSPAGGAALVGDESDGGSFPARGVGLLRRSRFATYLKVGARARAPLRFETGDPALVVSRLGRGRASLFAAGVGHLAGTPSVLVPLADALVRLAAARPPAPIAVEAGAAPLTVTFAPGAADRSGSARAALTGAADRSGSARLALTGASPARLTLLSPELERTRVRIVQLPRRGPVRPDAAGLPSETPAAAAAILSCDRPGLWKLAARRSVGGNEYVERLIGVNVEPLRPAAAAPAATSHAGGRLVGARSELIEALESRGSVGMAPVLALAALAALAAEIALARRHPAGSKPSPDSGGGRPSR